MSPAESAFSFFDEASPHAVSASDLMEEKILARPIDRGTPGESTYASINTGNQHQNELRRNKSQYYTEVFSYREPNLSPRDRISKDSVITAEIKTNVIVRTHSLFQPTVDTDQSLRVQDHRRDQLPPRFLSAPVPTIPKTYLLHIHKPQTFRMPPLCRYLRSSLHPHNQRPTLPNPSHNKQTQRRPDTSLRGRLARRGRNKRYRAVYRHTRRESCLQWYNCLWANRKLAEVSKQRKFLGRCVNQWHEVRVAQSGSIASAESETVNIEATIEGRLLVLPYNEAAESTPNGTTYTNITQWEQCNG